MAALTPIQREALEMLAGLRSPGKVLPATLQALLDDGWTRVGLYGEFIPTEAGVRVLHPDQMKDVRP